MLQFRTMVLLIAFSCVFSVAAVAGAAETEPGLQGEYYNIAKEMTDVPNIPAEQKPTLTKVSETLNIDYSDEAFNGTNLVEQFYVRWTGFVKIPKDGKYTFFVESDDGSHLSIDGKLLVDNGGLHVMEEKEGEVELKAGDHELKLDFFVNEKGSGCILRWKGDGIEKQVIPATALSHKK